MTRTIPIAAAVLALTAGLAAQDTTVTSRTEIEADDATAVSLNGCLQHDPLTGRYVLAGATAVAGDDVTTRTRVETDVDDDEVEVEVKSRTEADDAVGTSGRRSNYTLLPREGVALLPHVGKRVQVSAIVVDPGEEDAEVEIEEKTTVEREDAPDATRRQRTEVEIEGVGHGQYAVVSVKPLPGDCAVR